MTFEQEILRLIKKCGKSSAEFNGRFLLYGCTGYTGNLIAELASKYDTLRDDMMILGGRDSRKVTQLAQKLNFKQQTVHFTVGPKSVAKISQILREQKVGAVLNAAGPFSQTAKPMIDACVSAGVSYLDITGEIDVFEYSLSDRIMDSSAEKREICVISGVGFDVVPTDCLARKVVKAYRDQHEGDSPDSLQIAVGFPGGSGVSRGTLKTMIEGMVVNHGKTHVRRNGVITKVNMLAECQKFHFEPSGKDVECSAVSWGDVSTSYYSTDGVPNITVYFPFSAPAFVRTVVNLFIVQWILSLFFRIPFLLPVLNKMVEVLLPPGPDETSASAPEIVAIAKSKDGKKSTRGEAVAGPGYKFTAQSAVLSTLKVLAGEVNRYGCVTPSMAFGEDFIDLFDKSIATQKIVDTSK